MQCLLLRRVGRCFSDVARFSFTIPYHVSCALHTRAPFNSLNGFPGAARLQLAECDVPVVNVLQWIVANRVCCARWVTWPTFGSQCHPRLESHPFAVRQIQEPES